MIQKQI